MKAYKTIILVILGVAGGAALCLVGLIVYLNWPTDRTLAKNVAVTSNWTEFPIQPALNPSHRDQYIKLQIKGYSRDADTGSINGPLNLADGRTVDPQIELYDSAGQGYGFRHSGGDRKWVVEVVFRSDEGVLRGHGFTKVRIKSDAPFVCERISFEDYDPE